MRVGFFILLGFVSLKVSGQCPATDFSIDPAGCVEQWFQIQDNTTGATSWEWDFCSGDLALTPNSSVAVSNNLLFRTRSVRIIKHLNDWYGFAIDQASSPNRLIRFNFGSTLTNNPSITDLGNPSGMLNGAYDFQPYLEGGKWYLLVANTGANSIVKYIFESGLDAIPIAQNLGSFGQLNTPNGISIVNHDGVISAFVTSGGVAQITRLDFGASINNVPSAVSFPVSGASGLRGISITRECDRWFGLATSYGNGKIFWLDFVNGISQAPQSGEITFFTSYNFPASISILLDGGEYYSFIQSAVGPLYRLSFGTSIIDKTGTGQNLGSFGITENFASDWIKETSDWYGFSIDLTNRRLMKYSFPTTCDASQSTHVGSTPPSVNYATSGVKKVSLVSKNSAGVSAAVKAVSVSSSIAPDISISSQNICANHDVNFTSQNASGNILSYDWDFGDSNSSTQASPTHQYSSPGQFNVQLNVTADNGCENLSLLPVTMYYEPVADFLLPSNTPVCTNQLYHFQNTSSFDAASAPQWEWRVNGLLVSSVDDLDYAFNNPVSQEIRLKALIPGCENEAVKLIGSVTQGPSVDFIFSGQCEDDPVQFTNSTTGEVVNFSWDFDDSQNSSDVNPDHQFMDPGQYDVVLTATNSSGCINSKSKSVVIYSKPQTNFSIPLPPFSCSGSATQFTDLTPNPFDSNLSAWSWDFGNGNTSNIRNPQQVFTNAGDYFVSLTTTTNFGCSGMMQKTITIASSPVADFTNSPPCLGVPVNFSDASSGIIQSRQWQIENASFTTQNPAYTFSSTGNKNVSLTVTAANGCVGNKIKTVVVPVALNPDFTFTRNCVNQLTEFNDITLAGSDPILSRDWFIAGIGSGTANPQQFTFSNTGNYNMRLSVTTQTGCLYTVQKNVPVVNAPQAKFTANPSFGAPPLSVQFTNTSANATTYQWQFNDAANSTSSMASPGFTFTELGSYTVRLTAYSAQGCSHETTKIIQAVVPVFDISVKMLELVPFQNNSFKAAVTIHNKSNVPVTGLPLRFDFGDGLILRDYVEESIFPGETFRFITSFDFSPTLRLTYLCAEAEIADSSPGDNTACLPLQQRVSVIAPHPNPVTKNSELTIEWVSAGSGQVTISLVNTMGQIIFLRQAGSVEGLNAINLSMRDLQTGLYFLQLDHGDFVSSFRVVLVE